VTYLLTAPVYAATGVTSYPVFLHPDHHLILAPPNLEEPSQPRPQGLDCSDVCLVTSFVSTLQRNYHIVAIFYCVSTVSIVKPCSIVIL
jgi:hypothetical protein